MKIDIFAHIMTKKYSEMLGQKAKGGSGFSQLPEWVRRDGPLGNIDIRLRLLDRYPDVKQVLSISLPALVDEIVTPSDAIELARMANDELAEIVTKYPDKFVAAVACLPMNDVDAAVRETERAVIQLGLKGVQVFGKINGELLSEEKFWPIYEKMAEYDLPIWIHPSGGGGLGPEGNMFGWPFETSVAMVSLANSGIFEKYPDIKFITHHCGGMVSFFEQRVWWGLGNMLKEGVHAREHMPKFYNDTAVYGSTGALMCEYTYFGADNVLFGTDMPLGPGTGLTLATIRSVERMPIPDADKEKIFEGNAIKLLKLAV